MQLLVWILLSLLLLPVTTLFSALTLWVVGKLGLGFEVRRKRAVFWTALAMAVSSALINGLWRLIGPASDNGLVQSILSLVSSVLALLLADWIVPGFKAHGFWGVLISAVATGVVGWLSMLLLALLGPALYDWFQSQTGLTGSVPAEAGPATPAATGGLQLSIDWANRPFASVLLGIGIGIAILLIGRWIANLITRYASRSMERAHVDRMVVRFLRTLIHIGLLAVVVIAALNAAGIHTTSLTALFASAGVAIGLALKDSLANVAAGLMILLFKPYRVGDFVEAGGATGVIEEVSVFNTVMYTGDHVKMYVPNSSIVSGNIKNYSATDRRRIDLVAAIGYDANIGTARDILMEMIAAHPKVWSEPAPRVFVNELAESTVNLTAWIWVAAGDYLTVRGELLEQMKTRFDEAGISMPYPTREVIVRQG